MEKQEIGRFSATTFDERSIEFVAYDNHTIDCPTLGLESYRSIELKPRFVLYGEHHYIYDVKGSKKYHSAEGLVARYNIDEELLDYLLEKKMVFYSADMANLYGFAEELSWDKKTGRRVGKPYKWARKKGPILVKQKQGEFN